MHTYIEQNGRNINSIMYTIYKHDKRTSHTLKYTLTVLHLQILNKYNLIPSDDDDDDDSNQFALLQIFLLFGRHLLQLQVPSQSSYYDWLR